MITQILVSFILSLLPVWVISHESKYQLGILLNELFRAENLTWLKTIFKRNVHEVLIKGSISKGALKPGCVSHGTNMLYFRFQNYLISKFKINMKNYELVNIQGEIKFHLNDMDDTFVDHYKGHTINITIRSETNDDKESSTFTKCIVLRSRTANPDLIKQYVKEHTVCTEDSNTIKVLNPMVRKESSNTYVRWEDVSVRTNKSLKNTIYSEYVKTAIFEDVNHFINNEDWYKHRGIPYKRGYFLYGPPGTGKTSVAKIIANIYSLPIYNLDLSTIENNDVLTKLTLDIYETTNNNSHYILIIEDADSSAFFQKNSKLTMDCLLNILDGVMEPYGRILVVTSNNPDKFKEHKALMRPGRIDRYVEIGLCTKEQVMEMYNLFYSGNTYQPDWDTIEVDNLSPAYVMKHLQDNLENPEEFCKTIFFQNKQ